MKWIILVFAVLVVKVSDAQTLKVMAEQLAELKLLEHTTAVGYEVMTAGVDTIGVITGGELKLIEQNEDIISAFWIAGSGRTACPGAIDRRSAVAAATGQRKAHLLKEHFAANVPGLHSAGTRLYQYPGYCQR